MFIPSTNLALELRKCYITLFPLPNLLLFFSVTATETVTVTKTLHFII